MTGDSFRSRSTMHAAGRAFVIHRLEALASLPGSAVERLPFSLKILLENLLRHEDGSAVTADDIATLATWSCAKGARREVAFQVARVLLQDFTGVPAIADLAAMRDALASLGGEPARVNPLKPVDLVIDHSVQVDHYGTPEALAQNAALEFERNRERYAFLRWGQKAFSNLRVVPPDTGIVHQVNLEHLAAVVFEERRGAEALAYPDTLVGTDSHTTMVNALGVLGWGVGGIEAEAAMLGQPLSLLVPEVVGFELRGELPPGATATDLVLIVTQKLRERGVVGKFVEFFGAGLSSLSLADRATLANMAPEYGATAGFFPVDAETLRYLRQTGRSESHVALVEAYCKEQGLFRVDGAPDPVFSERMELDLAAVEPSLAGPRRPQDRVPLRQAKAAYRSALAALPVPRREPPRASPRSESLALEDGAVVIAAITSCTNTSNPSVLVAAGLVARKAVERGLEVRPWVKTSFAPGSKVATEYLREAGLLAPLESLRFHLVGFGCTTCIGNSGPLSAPVARAIQERNLAAVAVLSGNRNFEGRIHPLVRFNYLASPPLVVAYALAGTMDIDFESEPLGAGRGGVPVYLRDVWPEPQEVQREVERCVRREMFARQYARAFEGDERWRSLGAEESHRYRWDPTSTYVRPPPFLDGMPKAPSPPAPIVGARALLRLGDSITTDHISPAGDIEASSPAGRWLRERGVSPDQFNAYGARRGNHEVMVRGTFGNVRLRNELLPGVEGPVTAMERGGQPMSIDDAAQEYRRRKVPLLVLAGKEYGTGSSRDWAAKGTALLGVRAVIAESFERIHRANLVGMGVLPLQFMPGESCKALGLDGFEVFAVEGAEKGVAARQHFWVTAAAAGGRMSRFEVLCRIDTPEEASYFAHGGILPYMVRELLAEP